MGRYRGSDWCNVIKPTSKRWLCTWGLGGGAIVFSFLIFFVFGRIFGSEFNALNNQKIYSDSGIEMSKEQVLLAILMVIVQRILVYLLPAMVAFLIWKCLQLRQNYHSGVKLGIRVFLYFEGVVLFAYSVFSAVHYVSGMEYWWVSNPYANSEVVIFIASIILSRVLGDRIIAKDDDGISQLLFVPK